MSEGLRSRVPYRSYWGFTLVELLVVIAIVAMLVSLLLPALSSARETGRRAVCASHLRQWGVSLMNYDLDMRELPPGAWNVANQIRAGVHRVVRDSYGMSNNMTLCPSGILPQSINGRKWAENNDVGITNNYRYVGGEGGRPTEAGSEELGWTVSNFPSRTRGVYAILSISKPYTFKGTSVRPPLMPHANQPMMADFAWPKSDPTVPPHAFFPRRANHVDRSGYRAAVANHLFADGHVELQNLVAGTSWLFYGPSSGTSGSDSGGAYWITSRYPPPTTRVTVVVD